MEPFQLVSIENARAPLSRALGESAQYDWLKQKAGWPSCNDVGEPGKEEALKSKTSKKRKS